MRGLPDNDFFKTFPPGQHHRYTQTVNPYNHGAQMPIDVDAFPHHAQIKEDLKRERHDNIANNFHDYVSYQMREFGHYPTTERIGNPSRKHALSARGQRQRFESVRKKRPVDILAETELVLALTHSIERGPERPNTHTMHRGRIVS